jgi:hypothetical protein
VCGERAAGQDVPIVLAGVAVHREAAKPRVSRIRERAEAEIIEELLARIAPAYGRAALGTRLGGDARS